MHRRGFLASPVAAFAQDAGTKGAAQVFAYGDGIKQTPAEYARLLAQLAPGVESDAYSRGGVVDQLERKVASALGKETAVWLPTGTLANHLAVRTLAGARRRVLVQAESHLYNDTGDCAQTLSGLNLIPLARGKAAFTLAEAEAAAADSALGRVAAPVGAIQIETPVRRRRGEQFEFGQMTRIASWARGRQIGLHLDGARLFIESAYSRRPVRDYAALFDTVYISMYKYFNAASGAVLAGPKSLLADLFQTRRMFGGGLPQVWPCAAVAFHYFAGFEERFTQAVETSEKVLATLATDGNFEVERVANGTNVFRLRTTGVNAPVYATRLEETGIGVHAPVDARWITMQVNESWARIPPDEIVARMRKALG
ncbi:MAG TPA: beta-eliminating lyase-related protein [Bryobacteraceae bacterium]|nr:beta-eliminating lyase-related protein [Bryobacteraceae bacterium]